MASQINFILQFADGVSVSSGKGPSDGSAYIPITAVLDSTDPSPATSGVIELLVSLPEDYYCDDARIFFRGGTALSWDLASDQPTDTNEDYTWEREITVAVASGSATRFYARCRTTHQERPTDDRQTPIVVTGPVREAT